MRYHKLFMMRVPANVCIKFCYCCKKFKTRTFLILNFCGTNLPIGGPLILLLVTHPYISRLQCTVGFSKMVEITFYHLILASVLAAQ